MFAAIASLRVLQVTGTPLIKNVKPFRRVLTTRIPQLTYLNDRPIFDRDRRLAIAWFVVPRCT